MFVRWPDVMMCMQPFTKVLCCVVISIFDFVGVFFSFNSHYCYSDCDHNFFPCMRSNFFFVCVCVCVGGVSSSFALLSMFFLHCFFLFKSLCDHGCKRHITYSFQTWSFFVMLSDITLFACRFDSSPCGFEESISEWLVSTILVYLATFARRDK